MKKLPGQDKENIQFVNRASYIAFGKMA